MADADFGDQIPKRRVIVLGSLNSIHSN